jgi:cytochrome P450
MAEITLAEEQGRLSHPVQYTEAQTLPYFQAIIKEAMRVYPPVSVPLPRVIPPSSAEVLGFLLPGGTTIHLPQWAQLRRKDVYGEDADLFRPERWLEDEEKTKYWEKIDTSFGAGYCQCLGKNIAMMEINKAMIEVGDPVFDFDAGVWRFVMEKLLIVDGFSYSEPLTLWLLIRRGRGR